MRKLVLAEKPSVGLALASVLGASQRKDGYMEGNGYIVSWCFGHLAELANADAYNEKYAKWRYDDLPIVPDPWSVKIARDKRKQFDILRSLMNSADVDTVINVCDAGREGELIFRYVYELAKCTKPMQRLWLSSMEDAAIRKAFTELRPGSAYDRLYQAAMCRAKADWLVGINATRLFSVLYHRTLNVGRVVSPTLALIVQRDAEIHAFQSEAFYTVELTGTGVKAVSERFEEKSGAESLAAACQGNTATVQSVERKEKSEKPPALYDLTTLQRAANRLLGYTAQQTLDYLQSLYEKKLCTYPRTDARFLTDDMVSVVPNYAAVAAAVCGVPTPETVHAEQVCNSKKVSDHHAVIPTVSAKGADIAALPAGEREILRLVARQLLCAVSDAHHYTETAVTIVCGGATFTAKGKTELAPGWRQYMPQTEQQPEDDLPDLTENQTMPVTAAQVKEGKTTPPKSYTEDTLLSTMETAGVKETPEDAERKGLGTPATRAAILEKLVSAGFVERKKSKKTVSLIPAHTGVSLVTILPEQLQSPLLTAEWESKLSQIERGELEPETFLTGITDMLRELVKTYTAIKGAEVLFPSGREVIGKCPRCGGDVTESKKGFFCEKADCRFGLWRDNKYLSAKRISLTKKDAKALLEKGRVYMKDIYSEKTGKTYDADLLLTDNGERSTYSLDFGKETSA
ncbi:MAG: DNA topoisomerase 3 [Oscillospiraceae bacterium]|nr:DNA topoisomerase 3 [Oscillospiraceae bacterium]